MSVATKNSFALLDGLFSLLPHISPSNLYISQIRIPPDPQALFNLPLQRLLPLLPPILVAIRSYGEALRLEVESTTPEVAPNNLPQRMAI
jgi:uncharacterized membrane protein